MKLFHALLATTLTVSLSTGLSADQPELNDAGLALEQTPRFDTLYLAPDAGLDGYAQVYVETPTVAFRKDWQRTQNRHDPLKVRDRDMERIRTRMAELMKEVVTTEFTENGYRLAEAPGPGVLVLRPNIVKLDIVAPDIPDANRTFTYSESAGEMTLDLEVLDGASGEPLLQAMDRKQDPQRGYFEWRTRPGNTATARRMMRGWAEDIRRALEQERWLAVNG